MKTTKKSTTGPNGITITLTIIEEGADPSTINEEIVVDVFEAIDVLYPAYKTINKTITLPAGKTLEDCRDDYENRTTENMIGSPFKLNFDWVDIDENIYGPVKWPEKTVQSTEGGKEKGDGATETGTGVEGSAAKEEEEEHKTQA